MPYEKHHVLIHELKTKLKLKEVWYYCVTCLTARLTTTCITSTGTEQVAQNFNQLLEGQAVQLHSFQGNKHKLLCSLGSA